jgi:hypothetical protein
LGQHADQARRLCYFGEEREAISAPGLHTLITHYPQSLAFVSTRRAGVAHARFRHTIDRQAGLKALLAAVARRVFFPEPL